MLHAMLVGSKAGAVDVGKGSSCCRRLSRKCRCLSPYHVSVSSPRHIARSMRISNQTVLAKLSADSISMHFPMSYKQANFER